MNNNDLQKLMSAFESKIGKDGDSKNKARVENLLKGLNEEQAQKLKNVLSDPEKSKEILNSPAAKALMKKLMNNG